MFSRESYPREQSEDWSNCVDAQANQSSGTPDSVDFALTQLKFFSPLPPSQSYYSL